MTSKVIHDYLDRYAEPIVSLIQDKWLATLDRTYQSILVIPLFDEALNCLETVLPQGIHHTLIIAVVNAAVDADIAAIHHTQAFLNQFPCQPEAAFTVVEQPLNNTLLLVDCCTPTRQLPPKQGVGLARKIGGDIALTCIAAQKVKSPWIHCTDGDAQLPEDYFDTPNFDRDVAVAIYPFAHQPQHLDILHYEILLRYYVLGLAQANSPYAFQTIGSLLKINAEHYAKVRGFPKRKAAEDFYMLNKLAKTGKVIRLQHPTITLSSRRSHRVPFGTGATMVQLSRAPGIVLYHPQIFWELRQWLSLDHHLWQYFQHRTPSLKDKIPLQSWWQQQALSGSLLQTLLYLKADRALYLALQQSRDFEHFKFYLSTWFDAFRTLKFIHYQRDNFWPSLAITATLTVGEEFTIAPQFSVPAVGANQPPRDGSSQDFLKILQMLRGMESKLSSEVGPTCTLGRR